MPKSHQPKKKKVSPIQFQLVDKTRVSTRYKGSRIIAELIRVRTNDPESIARTNLDHIGFTGSVTAYGKLPITFTLTTQEPLITKSGHFSYKSFAASEKTKMLSFLLQTGNVSSAWLARHLGIGINAYQIGQLRRHNNPKWRTQRPKI